LQDRPKAEYEADLYKSQVEFLMCFYHLVHFDIALYNKIFDHIIGNDVVKINGVAIFIFVVNHLIAVCRRFFLPSFCVITFFYKQLKKYLDG
jgi:hypothetical protein